MERYTHVHCVCGSSESEHTSGRKNFILGSRFWGGGGGGDNKLSVLFKGKQKVFKAA